MTDPKRHSESVEVAATATQVPSYAITKKDGTVTEIKVPDGAKIEVDGKPVTVATKSPLAGWSGDDAQTFDDAGNDLVFEPRVQAGR